MKHTQFLQVISQLGFKLVDLDGFSDSKRIAIAYRDLDLGHGEVICKYRNSPGYFIGIIGGPDAVSNEGNLKEFLIDRRVLTAEDTLKHMMKR